MEKLTNDQLKDILRGRDLGTTGNKAQLMDRLREDLTRNEIDVEVFVTTTIEALKATERQIEGAR